MFAHIQIQCTKLGVSCFFTFYLYDPYCLWNYKVFLILVIIDILNIHGVMPAASNSIGYFMHFIWRSWRACNECTYSFTLGYLSQECLLDGLFSAEKILEWTVRVIILSYGCICMLEMVDGYSNIWKYSFEKSFCPNYSWRNLLLCFWFILMHMQMTSKYQVMIW